MVGHEESEDGQESWTNAPTRDVETKIDDPDIGVDLDIVQLHGLTRCPALKRWLAERDRTPDEIPREAFTEIHKEACSGDISKDEENPIDPRWASEDIRLRDYEHIHKQGLCPVRLAEARADRIETGELVVTTPYKLRYVLHRLVPTDPEDVDQLIVGFDEFDRLKPYLIVDDLELPWYGEEPRPWHREKAPENLPKDAAKLVETILNTTRVGQEWYPVDRNLRDLTYQLNRLKARAKAGDPDLGGRWERYRKECNPEGLYDTFPDFEEKIKTLATGLPDKEQDDILEKLGEETYVVSYLNWVLFSLWLTVHEDRRTGDYYRDILDALSGLGRPEPRSGWDGTVDPKSGGGGLDVRKAIRGLRGWLGKKMEDGDPTSLPQPWGRWVAFVLNMARSRTLPVPLVKEAENQAGEWQPDSIQLYAVERELTLVKRFLDAGGEVHLMSATPPPRGFLREMGIPTQRGSFPDLRDPLELRIVCEMRRRPLSSWKREQHKWEELLTRLEDQSDQPLVFFARSKEERERVKGCLPSGTDVFVQGSFENQAVELPQDRTTVICGPIGGPVGKEVARLRPEFTGGPETSYTYFSSEEVRDWTKIRNIVQAAYRPAGPDGLNGCIVLGCDDRFVAALERYLDEWDYEEDACEVATVEPTSGPGSSRRHVGNLLDTAGIPFRPSHGIRDLTVRLAEWLNSEGPEHQTPLETEWSKQVDVSDDHELARKAYTGVSQRDVTRALEYGEAQGIFELESGKPVRLADEWQERKARIQSSL